MLPSIHEFSNGVIKGENWANVHLPCVASGQPLPVYRWYKDGKIIEIDNDRYKLIDGGLVITLLRPEYSGSYTCVASNSHGDDRKTVTLAVYGNLFHFNIENL